MPKAHRVLLDRVSAMPTRRRHSWAAAPHPPAFRPHPLPRGRSRDHASDSVAGAELFTAPAG